MKIELLLVIIILIAIAIISLFISIWDVFITKKRTLVPFTATDFFYGLIIGILAGSTANVYIMLVVMQVIALWYIIIGIKTKENHREREQREMEQRNMSRYKKES